MKDTIVLYPAPAVGHVVSMVELGKLILHHHPHFSITILITTGPLDTAATTTYINTISKTNSSISFHPLPSVSLPLDPTPKHSRAAIAFEFIRLNVPNVLESLKTISLTSTIRALIASAIHTSYDPNIPTYSFFTSGASALVSILYLPTIHNQTTKSFKDHPPTTQFHIPGLPPIRASHFPEPVLDRDDQAYNEFINFSAHLLKTKGIIVNTFNSLESRSIKAIDDGVCVPNTSIPPVYYIGPLITDAKDRAVYGGDASALDCLSWLDAQPSQSVVYLCFGSRGVLSAAQLKEIAIGLERSGHRFLWVVRTPPTTDEGNSMRSTAATNPDLDVLLPEGFLDRTKDRGLVVKSWAPQMAVLSRESVGGFVTHCGWNSVMEAVSTGVPMIAWPLHAEQHINGAVLVGEMKLAVALEKSEEDGLVSAMEVEKGVRELMESAEGKAVRHRSREMRQSALAAWTDGGSSLTAFSKLVESWK